MSIIDDIHEAAQDLAMRLEDLTSTVEGVAWDQVDFKQLSIAGFEALHSRLDSLEDKLDRIEASLETGLCP